jgi:hypothetical protein
MRVLGPPRTRAHDVGNWHEMDMLQRSLYVRSWGQSGKRLLGLSFSAFDPFWTFFDVGQHIVAPRKISILPA